MTTPTRLAVTFSRFSEPHTEVIKQMVKENDQVIVAISESSPVSEESLRQQWGDVSVSVNVVRYRNPADLFEGDRALTNVDRFYTHKGQESLAKFVNRSYQVPVTLV